MRARSERCLACGGSRSPPEENRSRGAVRTEGGTNAADATTGVVLGSAKKRASTYGLRSTVLKCSASTLSTLKRLALSLTPLPSRNSSGLIPCWVTHTADEGNDRHPLLAGGDAGDVTRSHVCARLDSAGRVRLGDLLDTHSSERLLGLPEDLAGLGVTKFTALPEEQQVEPGHDTV